MSCSGWCAWSGRNRNGTGRRDRRPNSVGDAWHAHSLAADIKVTQTYAREIRTAGQQGATFVVTSEGDMASIPDEQSAIVAPLVAASRQTGVQIIAGFHSDTPPADFALVDHA